LSFSVPQATYFSELKNKWCIKKINDIHKKFSIDCEVSFKGQDGLLKIYISVRMTSS